MMPAGLPGFGTASDIINNRFIHAHPYGIMQPDPAPDRFELFLLIGDEKKIEMKEETRKSPPCPHPYLP
jgi:hypothetical protein